ncbi:hypothetical protein KKK_13180 [Pseudomonas putida B6-2]|nr:hypothetical protein KKK_13180 [Pseudomonas putida B6-2]
MMMPSIFRIVCLTLRCKCICLAKITTRIFTVIPLQVRNINLLSFKRSKVRMAVGIPYYITLPIFINPCSSVNLHMHRTTFI